MTLGPIEEVLSRELADLEGRGMLKGRETVYTGMKPAAGTAGPRWYIEGEGSREFLKMNSNSYLGLSFCRDVIEAGERGSRLHGAGPGAVRFISGTCAAHVELERGLADFHGRESCLLFSAAYSAVLGILPPLITTDTAVVSDELNHNCIINAIRLSRPAAKSIYRHGDTPGLERALAEQSGRAGRAVVVTDGIFSMRGDWAPLEEIGRIVDRHRPDFKEGILLVVDDSHGVGAIGRTGRGTEEHTGGRADILVATLGKALGVNGGYAVSSRTVTDFLRETSASYVYSNPVTPSEAAAAGAALRVLDGARGRDLLVRLRGLVDRFESGLERLGLETIPGPHPIVPLMVRDGVRTGLLVRHLYDRGIVVTGLRYPVVPKGSEEIRFQVSAEHTEGDIDSVLEALESFRGEGP